MTDEINNDWAGMTADIVSAYVSNNRVAPDEVAGLIQSVHSALTGLSGEVEPVESGADYTKSKGEIRKSITHDHLISFIDGKPYKTLKRHLTTNGLTPDEYRARFGLAADYPLVAPAYSEARSRMAKEIGLGAGGRGRAAAKPVKGRKAKAEAASESA